MPFFTYILQSETTSQLYTGQTNNLEDRILRHNKNQNKWTRHKGPWVLLFACQFDTRSEAVHLERKLKSYKDKAYVLAWIEKKKENLADQL